MAPRSSTPSRNRVASEKSSGDVSGRRRQRRGRRGGGAGRRRGGRRGGRRRRGRTERERPGPAVDGVEVVLAHEVGGDGRRRLRRGRRRGIGPARLRELHVEAAQLPVDAVGPIEERPDPRLGHDDGVNLLAGDERHLVEHGEVGRIAGDHREAAVGEDVRERLEAIGELTRDEPDRRGIEPQLAVQRRDAVTLAERARQGLLGHGPELEQVRPEPAAEDDLVLERVAHRTRRARAGLHQELAEAGGHGPSG
jgi:hypothetical protein